MTVNIKILCIENTLWVTNISPKNHVLRGPTYISEYILWRNVFPRKILDIIWNSSAILTTRTVSQNLMTKEYVTSGNTKDKSN